MGRDDSMYAKLESESQFADDSLYASGWRSVFHPRGPSYRFLVLFSSCMLTFGSYYCFDLPSTIEGELTSSLGINSEQYNLFYSLYAWTNCLFVILAGILIDRVNKRVGALLFSSSILLGQIFFALGGTVKNYPIMCVGRFLFGSGGGPITIVQYSISTHYFKGKELALAFGVTTMASRLGSVINFLGTASLTDATSLVFVLWFSVFMCVLSFLNALLFCFLDSSYEKENGKEDGPNLRKINLSDVKDFPVSYWLLDLICSFFYICLFAFIANASDFFQTKYGLSSTNASYIAGTAYYIAIPGSPLMGVLLDRVGRRTFFLLFGCLLTLPTYTLFLFSDITPIVPMCILGIAYVVSAGCLWASVPLLVPSHQVGTATGLMTSVQMLGLGFAGIAVGSLIDNYSDVTSTGDDTSYIDVLSLGYETDLDKTRGYHAANYFFLGSGCVACLLAFVLLCVDLLQNGTLMYTSAATRKAEEEKRLIN